jgi:uncharacterized protein
MRRHQAKVPLAWHVFDAPDETGRMRRIMSVSLPESVDAWRMVSARRAFAGELPISAMPRLCEVLADRAGVAQYEMAFGRDELGTACLDLKVRAPVTLLCQRTLEPFVLPLAVEVRLGMIRAESEEAGLPPGCEPLLIGADARLKPAEVIEDELLLALPLVPMDPQGALPAAEAASPDEDEAVANPFAILSELKRS